MRLSTPATTLLLLALLAAAAVSGAAARELQASATPAPAYASVGDALAAAANAPTLTTLLDAIKAANLTIPEGAAWTIFAPTNAAFDSDAIKKTTGLAASDLLKPDNKAALVKVLSYHVVPAAAVSSGQLKDGQKLDTALPDASLYVSLAGGKVLIKTSAKADSGATVVAPDIKAGNSIIHVIDGVLIPPSLVKP